MTIKRWGDRDVQESTFGEKRNMRTRKRIWDMRGPATGVMRPYMFGGWPGGVAQHRRWCTLHEIMKWTYRVVKARNASEQARSQALTAGMGT